MSKYIIEQFTNFSGYKDPVSYQLAAWLNTVKPVSWTLISESTDMLKIIAEVKDDYKDY